MHIHFQMSKRVAENTLFQSARKNRKIELDFCCHYSPCEQKFGNYDDLRVHREEVHFPCRFPGCGLHFSSREGRRAHVISHLPFSMDMMFWQYPSFALWRLEHGHLIPLDEADLLTQQSGEEVPDFFQIFSPQSGVVTSARLNAARNNHAFLSPLDVTCPKKRHLFHSLLPISYEH